MVSAAAGSPRRFAVRLVSDDQTVGQTDLSAAPPSGSELCMPTLRHAGITIFNLYSVRHSKAAIGSFITRIFAELCIILREINHPLTDGLCIISWRTNSVGQYTESRRLYSLLLGMEYGWSTSSAMYYTSDRARTLVAREVVLRLLL